MLSIDEDDETASTSHATLCHLRSISVHANTPTTSRIFDLVTAPALWKIIIDVSRIEGGEDQAASAATLKSSLAAFMERFSCVPEQASLRIPSNRNPGTPPLAHLPFPLDLWCPASEITAAGITRPDLLAWLEHLASSVQSLCTSWTQDLLAPHQMIDGFGSILPETSLILPSLKALSVDLEVP